MTRKLSKAGSKILAGAREAAAFARGEPVPGAVVHHKPVDVAAIRAERKLSQAKFAEAYGLDVRTVQEWEQGRRIPERPVQLYLRMIEHEPAAVARTLKKLREATD
jgi:putative transcriptional regulator